MPIPANTIRPLWVTSFAADMYEASGQELLRSFLSFKTGQDILVCTEGMSDLVLYHPSVAIKLYALEESAFLRDWLDRNADIIPEHLGGKHDGICRCPGGPLEVHDKHHKQPCVGAWFNRNASRWFRKMASLYRARTMLKENPGIYTAIIWVDADCIFKAAVTTQVLYSWFRGHVISRMPSQGRVRNRVSPAGVGAFYLRSRRPVLEAGCFGFNISGGGMLALDALIERYASGAFRRDRRWDDSYQIQRTLETLLRERKMDSVDLAYNVGEHAGVFAHSALQKYLEHRKGRHSRGLGIMT